MRTAVLIALLLGCAAGVHVMVAERTRRAEAELRAAHLTGGNPARGRTIAREVGCVACHVMPGVPGPETRVGPPLEKFGQSSFVAGAAENTPENVIQFLRDPRSVAPQSAMPNLRLTETQARDLAAYLYSLR